MRKQLFAEYAQNLGAKEGQEFMKRLKTMTPKDKKTLELSLTSMMHEVRNRYQKPEPDLEFSFQEGGTSTFADGQDAADLFVPIIGGQPLSFEGLIPQEQRAFVVKDETNIPQQPRQAPRQATTRTQATARPAQLSPQPAQAVTPTKVGEPISIPTARTNKFKRNDSNGLTDPETGKTYIRESNGKYTEYVASPKQAQSAQATRQTQAPAKPSMAGFKPVPTQNKFNLEDYYAAPKGEEVKLDSSYTSRFKPVKIQGASREIFADPSTGKYYERSWITGKYMPIGLGGASTKADEVEKLSSQYSGSKLSPEVVARFKEIDPTSTGDRRFYDPQTNRVLEKNARTGEYKVPLDAFGRALDDNTYKIPAPLPFGKFRNPLEGIPTDGFKDFFRGAFTGGASGESVSQGEYGDMSYGETGAARPKPVSRPTYQSNGESVSQTEYGDLNYGETRAARPTPKPAPVNTPTTDRYNMMRQLNMGTDQFIQGQPYEGVPNNSIPIQRDSFVTPIRQPLLDAQNVREIEQAFNELQMGSQRYVNTDQQYNQQPVRGPLRAGNLPSEISRESTLTVNPTEMYPEISTQRYPLTEYQTDPYSKRGLQLFKPGADMKNDEPIITIKTNNQAYDFVRAAPNPQERSRRLQLVRGFNIPLLASELKAYR